MKSLIQVFSEITQTLESNNIPYMIVGSMASMVYGEPRLTHDIDIVLNILPSDGLKFADLFKLKDYYCPPPEIINSEITHKGQFNLIHQETQIKIDLIIRKNTSHSIEEFDRRQKITFWDNQEAYIAQPEDVIIKKLSYYREGGSPKHISDIRGILANTEIDTDYLNKWVDELQLQKQFNEI